MHEIRFRLQGLRPRPRWESLQLSPDPLAGFGGRFAAEGRGWAGEEEREGEGKGMEGEVKRREREGPKLLLNQGPSEPCYATENARRLSMHLCLSANMITAKDNQQSCGRVRMKSYRSSDYRLCKSI